MAATPIASSTRYFDVNTTKVYWVETISDKSAPTRSELNGGTDLTGEIADFSGFTVSAEEIETPDMNSLFTSKIGGRTAAEDSSLTMYGDRNGDDVTDLLQRGDDGFVVWLDGGDTAANKMDVYPVRVRSISRQRSISDAARVLLEFSVTSEPAEGVAVPA